ncbi:hypothetical protein GCM10009850_072870 [Nonomuraea monospora]|uniref:Core-binding (CB) domain-containing protein n=1 Tax=Nonomuraea monospora TaxID=568818 RepID=A0ABN3CQW8_9ACTN
MEPNLTLAMYARYESFVRLYLVPGLGSRRLDKLTVKHVREWRNKLRRTCQCCALGKDAQRRTPKRCAMGKCCQSVLSARTIKDARDSLRAAPSIAITEEIISKSATGAVRLPMLRRGEVLGLVQRGSISMHAS